MEAVPHRPVDPIGAGGMHPNGNGLPQTAGSQVNLSRNKT